MFGPVYKDGKWTCRHSWRFTTFGKLQFKTCTYCGRQFMKSDDSEEWTLVNEGYEDWG